MEDHAKMLVVIKRMLVSDDSFLIALISSVDVFENLFLDLGRFDVFRDWPDDLNRRSNTFIA